MVLRPVPALLLLLLIASPLAAQVYPPIHDARPRIRVDAERLDWLRAHVRDGGACQQAFDQLTYNYTHWWINDPQLFLEGSDSSRWTWDWSSQWANMQAVMTVFFARVTDDSLARKRCRFLAGQVSARLDTASYGTMEWYEKEDLLRAMSDAGALLLDWCHDDLPSPTRRALASSLYAMTREFMNTYILSSAGTSYVSSHNALNTIDALQGIFALAGAEGLDAAQEDSLRSWYHTIMDKWDGGFLPCYGHYRGDDGGWNWGAAYSMWSLTDQFAHFDNIRIATGKNYFHDLPWVRNSINQYWYFIQPDGRTIHLGDGMTALSGDNVVYRHAALFADARSLWLAQELSRPERITWTWPLFTMLLHRDFTAGPVSHPQPPLDWYSPATGLAVSRSSWDADATMVTFFCSPSKRAAHEHRDNNAFTVFRRVPLLLDAGHYDSYATPHYRDYYSRTIAHNSVCVLDSADAYTSFGSAASNDGGQIDAAAMMAYRDIFAPASRRGRWLRHAAGSGWAYCAADATLSYDPAKVDLFRRRLLFLKPARIIVLDHLHLVGTATQQRDPLWTAHFAEQPVLSGTQLGSSVPGHIDRFEAEDCTASHGGGSVALRTLLPSNATATRIGGAGYEYWVDGMNRPLAGPYDSTLCTPGAWRVEVHTPATADTIRFLHTITVGDGASPVAAGGRLVEGGVSVGVLWNDTLVVFSRDGRDSTAAHDLGDVAGGGILHLLAFDLLPGTYRVWVDGRDAGETDADSNGIAEADIALASGAHRIALRPGASTVAPPPAPDDALAVAWPNPVKGQLHLRSLGPMERVLTVTLGDVLGKTVTCFSFAGTAQIDVRHCPAGVYMLRISDGGRSRTRPLLLLR